MFEKWFEKGGGITLDPGRWLQVRNVLQLATTDPCKATETHTGSFCLWCALLMPSLHHGILSTSLESHTGWKNMVCCAGPVFRRVPGTLLPSTLVAMASNPRANQGWVKTGWVDAWNDSNSSAGQHDGPGTPPWSGVFGGRGHAASWFCTIDICVHLSYHQNTHKDGLVGITTYYNHPV